MLIRDASSADVPAILAIHNDVIATTTAIYEDRPATLEERSAWFEARRRQGWPVLVAVEDGAVAGFSSFADWRSRWGYRHTVEHTVHVCAARRGHGLGRALVEALFPRAAALGMHVMVGHIDAQMTASRELHRKLGFEVVGTFRQVGHKFGRWLDLLVVQRFL